MRGASEDVSLDKAAKVLPFSVVIPAYNVQDYIEQTLDSVFSQMFTDFEVVVVDDGSTDCTGERVMRYSDPRLRIIHQRNRGECCARNRGIAEATGRYVAFLDADDIWLPYHLQLAHDFFRSHPSANWYASIPEGFRGNLTAEMLTVPAPACPIANMKSFYDGVPILPSSTCMRRSAIKEADLFEPGMKSGGDKVGWLRFCLTTGDMLGVAMATTVYYRMQRPGAATALGEGYNEKFVGVYLNLMTACSELMRRFPSNLAANAYMRRENRRHWGWCVRYAMLQGWTGSLRASRKIIGRATVMMRGIAYLHSLMTSLFYIPFYLYSKLERRS